MESGAGRDWAEAAVGGMIVLAAWALRGVCPSHGLPVFDAPEDWIATFVALDRAVGVHFLDAAARGAHLALLHFDYLLSFAVLRAQGAVADFDQFSVFLVQDPAPFWSLARSSMAAVGAGTVAAVFVHGRRLGGLRWAVPAAVFLAVAFPHVEVSRRVTPDAVLTLVLFWTLALIAEAATERRPVRTLTFLLVGTAALRAGWIGAILAVPYVWGAWMGGGARGVFSVRGIHALTVAAALAGLATLVSSAPLPGAWAGIVSPGGGAAGLGAAGTDLLRGVGPGVLGLAVLGAILAARSGPPGIRLHAIFPLLVGAAMLFSPSAAGSAAAVVLPSVCLLAAFGLEELAERLRAPVEGKIAVIVALAGLVLVEPGMATWRFVRHDCAVDTRQLAATWIEERVEPRTTVVVPCDRQVPWEPMVPLNDLKRNLRDRLAHVRHESPGAVRYWETLLRTRPSRKYDLQLVEGAASWESAAAYRSRGVGFAVIPLPEVGQGQDDVPAGRLRAELAALPGARLTANFVPFDSLTRGPRLEIWQITPPEARGALPADPDIDGL